MIDGTHCEKCSNQVTETIHDIPGVAGIVNLKKGIVPVSYEQEIADGLIKTCIQRYGYTVSNIR